MDGGNQMAAGSLLEFAPIRRYTLTVKYCVLVIDGASGWPLSERGRKTCLELAHIPNLDRMAGEGTLGLDVGDNS